MIFLDTCAVVWDALEPDRLSDSARSAIDEGDRDGLLLISDISLWEIAMLVRKSRIQIRTSTAKFLHLMLKARKIRVQTITPEIVELSVSLGNEITNDPADRIIMASAIVNKARLVTADQNLLNTSLVESIW